MVVVIMVVTVDTSGYVTDVWLLSAIDHVDNGLDYWLLVHSVDNWCVRHYTGHWLLVDSVGVCALVDRPGGCLVRDSVHNWRLRYRCGGLTGTGGHRDVAWLETQQVVVGLCVCQLGALRLGGECGCVCTRREVHMWVVQSVVQRSRELRGNAWGLINENGGQNGGLVRVAGGREVCWQGVGKGTAQWGGGCEASSSRGARRGRSVRKSDTAVR